MCVRAREERGESGKRDREGKHAREETGPNKQRACENQEDKKGENNNNSRARQVPTLPEQNPSQVSTPGERRSSLGEYNLPAYL